MMSPRSHVPSALELPSSGLPESTSTAGGGPALAAPASVDACRAQSGNCGYSKIRADICRYPYDMNLFNTFQESSACPEGGRGAVSHGLRRHGNAAAEFNDGRTKR